MRDYNSREAVSALRYLLVVLASCAALYRVRIFPHCASVPHRPTVFNTMGATSTGISTPLSTKFFQKSKAVVRVSGWPRLEAVDSRDARKRVVRGVSLGLAIHVT